MTEQSTEKKITKAQKALAKARIAGPKDGAKKDPRAKKDLLESELQDFTESPHVQQMSPSWQKLYAVIRRTVSRS